MKEFETYEKFCAWMFDAYASDRPDTITSPMQILIKEDQTIYPNALKVYEAHEEG